MKRVYRALQILHAFVGIGGMFGGAAAIVNTKSPLGITVDALKYSPFNSFLIPGIILFSVIGLGNVFSAISIKYQFRCQGYISSIFGWALMIWIVVQCIMLRNIHILHVIFFIIGLIVAVLAAIILFKHRQFPANIVIRILKPGNRASQA